MYFQHLGSGFPDPSATSATHHAHTDLEHLILAHIWTLEQTLPALDNSTLLPALDLPRRGSSGPLDGRTYLAQQGRHISIRGWRQSRVRQRLPRHD